MINKVYYYFLQAVRFPPTNQLVAMDAACDDILRSPAEGGFDRDDIFAVISIIWGFFALENTKLIVIMKTFDSLGVKTFYFWWFESIWFENFFLRNKICILQVMNLVLQFVLIVLSNTLFCTMMWEMHQSLREKKTGIKSQHTDCVSVCVIVKQLCKCVNNTVSVQQNNSIRGLKDGLVIEGFILLTGNFHVHTNSLFFFCICKWL